LLWAWPAEGSYRVTNLRCSAVPGGAEVILEANGPIEHSSFTMGEPEPRLVVDLFGAVHALPQYRYGHTGTDLIGGIRTSQYQPYPQPSMRVVLDMPRLWPYKIWTEDRRLIIALCRPADADVGPTQGQIDSMAQGSAERQTPVPAQGQEQSPLAATPSAQAQSSTEPSAWADDGVEDVQEPEDSVAEKMMVAALDDTIAAARRDSSSEAGETLLSRLLALGIREPVAYDSDNRRDPFVPLPAGQEVEFGQAPLPDVEKLTIVGILEGVSGYRALAQDDQNNGYVLRKGDRVLYGYVARVEPERAVFRLNQRGLDRTVILKLPQ
jgi:hypothetical protein